MKTTILILAVIFSLSVKAQTTIQNIQIYGKNPITCIYGSSPTDTLYKVAKLDTMQIGTAYTIAMNMVRDSIGTGINYIILQNTVKQTGEKKYPQRFIVVFKNKAITPKLIRINDLFPAQQTIYNNFINQCINLIKNK